VRRLLSSVRPVVALAAAALFCVPLYLFLTNVFKRGNDINDHPGALPIPFTLDNLRTALTRPDHLFWTGLRNSATVTLVSVLLLTALSAMLGHYIARSQNRAAKVVLPVLLAGLMIPTQVILLPLAKVLQATELMGTVQGLVLFNIGYYVPFGVFFFHGFCRQIPREVEEAAALDGAGRFRTFWQIVFPLMRPATASVMTFLSVWIWNDFLNPLIILGPANGTTITVGIYRSVGQHQTDFGGVFAMMFLAMLPILVLYFVLQKQFIKGLTGGAAKG
jgi:raffinose/stachyose/melibiose transport system permease protein